MVKKIATFFIFVWFSDFLYAQFFESCCSPLNIPLKITGNYGDIRNGSFHFGIDYTTSQKTGYPVFSINDGVVSRVKVEPGGYGRAIYIDHLNGYTSVYAHLDSFYGLINEVVKDEQYRRKSFSIDINFKNDVIRIKKCDTIGYSGNSGASSGPHLHFELRETKTQVTINSLLLNFNQSDLWAPKIRSIIFYNYKEFLDKNFLPINQIINVKNKIDTISVPSIFCIGIEAYDFINASNKEFNVFETSLLFDDKLIFDIKFDQLSFDETNMVNGQIDYYQKVKDKRNVLLLFQHPNSSFSIIKHSENKGIITIKDLNIHKIEIKVSDFRKNSTSYVCYVKPMEGASKNINNQDASPFYHFVSYNNNYVINFDHVKFVFPKGCLFNNIMVETKTETHKDVIHKKAYRVGTSTIPLKKVIEIHFPISLISPTYYSKAIVVFIDNDKIISCGGNVENNYIVGRNKRLGLYALAIDTVTPSIKPLNVYEQININKIKEFKFLISDNLSGVASYEGYINNRWVLFEYDKKNNLLFYRIDNKRIQLETGNHQLRLIVKDFKNNTSIYVLNFRK